MSEKTKKSVVADAGTTASVAVEPEKAAPINPPKPAKIPEGMEMRHGLLKPKR